MSDGKSHDRPKVKIMLPVDLMQRARMRHRWRVLTCWAVAIVASSLVGATPAGAFERYNRVKKFDPY